MTAQRVILERLTAVYEVTEYRDGCAYKTRYVEERWVGFDEPTPAGWIYAPLSSERMKELVDKGQPNIRRRAVQ